MLDLRSCGFALLVAVSGVVGSTGGAWAVGGCDMYGKLALQQQKQNEANKCGFSGADWSSDLKAHVAWCQGVAPQDWQAMLTKRTKMLEECKPKG